MSDLGAGNGHGPVFVDIYGTARRRGLGDGNRPENAPDEPLWKSGLKGHMPLWLAFWGGFVFGHGFVLAFTLGAAILATVLGFSVDPTGMDSALTVAGGTGVVVGAVMLVFVAWAGISVWRCARNTADIRWGYAARAVVLIYLAAWGTAVWHIAS